jgi:hypothetical protein
MLGWDTPNERRRRVCQTSAPADEARQRLHLRVPLVLRSSVSISARISSRSSGPVARVWAAAEPQIGSLLFDFRIQADPFLSDEEVKFCLGE